jgi:hypothetical protein
VSTAEIAAYLPPWWPWGLVLLELVVIAAAAFWWRDELLGWERGKYWPVGAALLPPLIPIARSLEETAPSPVRYATVAGLLLAVAVFQLYGQARNNRDRTKTERRFIDLINGIEQQGVEIRRSRVESETRLLFILHEVQQQGIAVGRIANGITAVAAQAKEETEDD